MDFLKDTTMSSLLKDTCNKYFPAVIPTCTPVIERIRIPYFLPRECPATIERLVRTTTASLPTMDIYWPLFAYAYLCAAIIASYYLIKHFALDKAECHYNAMLEVKKALLAIEKEDREAEMKKFVEEIGKIDLTEESLSMGQRINEYYPDFVFIFKLLVEGVVEAFKKAVAGGYSFFQGPCRGKIVEKKMDEQEMTGEETFEIVERKEKVEEKKMVAVELSEEEWKVVQGARERKCKEELGITADNTFRFVMMLAVFAFMVATLT
jgi:hypothetical protein